MEQQRSRRWGGTAAKVALGVVIVAMAALPIILRPTKAHAGELSQFENCAEVRTYLEESARASSRDQGIPAIAERLNRTADSDVASAAPAEAAQSAGSGAGDTGSTNVQVAGVDELDVVDTDGTLLVVARQQMREAGGHGAGALALVDPAAGRELDSEPLAGSGHQLTLDTASNVVWVTSYDSDDNGHGMVTRITRVRVENGSLTKDGDAEVRGSLVGARRVGDRLHVVASDGGGPVPLVKPGAEGRAGASGAVEDLDSSQVPPAPAEVRLPFEGGDVQVPCDAIWHPAGPSQPTALLAATFKASDEAKEGTLIAGEVVEIAGGGSLLYGTADALYVATTLFDERQPETSVHRFGLDGLRWTGSGRVPGVPLNQFAFDEHNGVLRVATTVDSFSVMVEGDDQPAPATSPPDAPVRDDQPNTAIASSPPVRADVDNLVLTLDTDGDLDEIGRLAGLGEPGERIRGVRFAGDVGYVVTFRQTDPLYVVDLSDPKAPKTSGELKLPGFSAYLHPIDGGLLVGIGQAGTDDGRLLGAQAQLFDVSDPKAPRLVDQEPLGGHSPAGEDHLAFASLGDGKFAVPSVDYPDRPVPLQRELLDDREAPAAGGAGATGSVSAETLVVPPEGGPDVTIEPQPPITKPEPPVTIEPQPVPPRPEPLPVPVPSPVRPSAPPEVSVITMLATDAGLERAVTFQLRPDAGATDAYSLLSGAVRTVKVGDRIAILAGSYGIALFEQDGNSLGWVVFEKS